MPTERGRGLVLLLLLLVAWLALAAPSPRAGEQVRVTRASRSGNTITLVLQYETNHAGEVWAIYSADADAETPYAGYADDWFVQDTGLPFSITGTSIWNGPIFITGPTFTNGPVRIYSVVNTEIDSDGDALYDGRELFLLHTLADSVDTDGDGLVDGASGLVALSNYLAGVDADGDGFVDGESDAGTDPLNADTDGDLLSDGAETAAATDPTNPDTTRPSIVILHPAPSSTPFLIP